MIRILKASAGSGKTYTLSRTYRKLLLDAYGQGRRDEYRHILAVTFTNMATAEMKDRILKDLSATASDASDPDAAVAFDILGRIVHDYNAFNVSTIDAFFQKVLRSFAREVGQYASYGVELDKSRLTDEAVDEILDNLDPDDRNDAALISYLLGSVREKLSSGKAVKVEEQLREMAVRLRSESFMRLSRQAGIDPSSVFDPLRLSTLKSECRCSINSFNGKLRDFASRIAAANAAAGLDYSLYNRGWLGKIEAYLNPEDGVMPGPPTEFFCGTARDPEKWFSKKNAGFLPQARQALGSLPEDFVDMFGTEEARIAATCSYILGSIDGLSIAVRLQQTFDNLLKEKNVVCLDESNTILKDIIAGSDAPFVYEKVGTRIDHFLLDEFQDTSKTQWDNFRPLLENSVAQGGNNLIVGDVKQSIYRWRESDWNLLDSVVPECFKGKAVTDSLEGNWRSLKNIVDFNNEFYPFASSRLDSSGKGAGPRPIRELYVDRKADGQDRIPDQKIEVFDKQGREGYVEIRIAADRGSELSELVRTIEGEVAAGRAGYGDFAVLVRRNREGAEVAAELVSRGIPIVTQASLCLKTSLSVRRLVALMHYIDNPDDNINTFIAKEFDLSSLGFAYHSLPDLVRRLCTYLLDSPVSGDGCRSEYTYVTAFIDYVSDYSASGGNGLHAFLEKWDDPATAPCLASSFSDNAVNILTIHKSKGLAFNYVIIPFVEDIELYHNSTSMWLLPQKDASFPAPFDDRLFYLQLNSGFERTRFADAYGRERYDQMVDALNMLYVATTRARKSMLIIGSKPARAASSSIFDIVEEYALSGKTVRGVPFTFEKPANSGSGTSYRLDPGPYPLGSRLSIRPYAEDFFKYGDNSLSSLSPRSRGIVIHDIMSKVVNPCDLASAIDAAIAEGALSEDSREPLMRHLQARIAEHTEFYPEDAEVLVETSFFDAEGNQKRPDRVVIREDGSVTVVDFKTGSPRPGHTEQVEGYRDIFLGLGYSKVDTFLWYL